MARVLDQQLRGYFDKKRAELREHNLALAKEGRHPMRNYVVQFVVDAATEQVYCATRFIDPVAVERDLRDAQADLGRLVREHVDLIEK